MTLASNPLLLLSFLTTHTLLGCGFAHALQLELPVNCEIGKDCFIQNYFDHQDGITYKDYRCGYLTYDNHTGTDFRVKDEHVMARGVSVIAAASGRVVGVRDGEIDIAVSIHGQNNVAGKEAGNGVLLDHGNGWQTQYSHLRRGSLLVKKGDWVESGQAIGLIGESGNADFPHVDFTVRKNGKAVDPFWPDGVWACDGKSQPSTLWSATASRSLSYIKTALLGMGFNTKLPTRFEAQTGSWQASVLSSQSSQLVLWASVMGANDGDSWHIIVLDPNGNIFADVNGKVSGNKAVLLSGGGRTRPPDLPWPEGMYKGTFTLIRQNQSILSHESEVRLVKEKLH